MWCCRRFECEFSRNFVGSPIWESCAGSLMNSNTCQMSIGSIQFSQRRRRSTKVWEQYLPESGNVIRVHYDMVVLSGGRTSGETSCNAGGYATVTSTTSTRQLDQDIIHQPEFVTVFHDLVNTLRICREIKIQTTSPITWTHFPVLTLIGILLAFTDTLLAAVESIARWAESAQIATRLLLCFEVSTALVNYGSCFHRRKLYKEARAQKNACSQNRKTELHCVWLFDYLTRNEHRLGSVLESFSSGRPYHKFCLISTRTVTDVCLVDLVTWQTFLVLVTFSSLTLIRQTNYNGFVFQEQQQAVRALTSAGKAKLDFNVFVVCRTLSLFLV